MPKSAPSQAEVIGHREADGWVVTDRGHCGLEKAELQIRVSRSEQPWDWVRPWTAAVWNPQGTGKRTPGPVPPSGTWTRWSFARTANAARSAGIRSWGSAATPRCQPTAASWTCWRTRPGHPPGKGSHHVGTPLRTGAAKMKTAALPCPVPCGTFRPGKPFQSNSNVGVLGKEHGCPPPATSPPPHRRTLAGPGHSCSAGGSAGSRPGRASAGSPGGSQTCPAPPSGIAPPARRTRGSRAWAGSGSASPGRRTSPAASPA
mmetsp:Transcript_71342/g.119428  ORF Transcript_71342/g.119428 Transcript_71342/m.119428 type:complete len:260 (-) Transcript_71342:502-1281(-)